MKQIFIFLFLLIYSTSINAQELNARVSVNTDRLEPSQKQIFTSLQNSLAAFINNNKWSSAVFSQNEKIDCSFSISVLKPSEDSPDYYEAEIAVVARRPVYNSSYTTNLLNIRDTKFGFEYVENTPIEYVENSLSNNLIATVAFYCYLILGMDFDSFSPRGGAAFFRQAQSISMQAQGYSNWTGWTAFESTNNRHAIITALMDESLSGFHDFWYTYHRKGLDEMAANPDRGRTTIVQALPVLKEIKNTRSSSVLLQMFADSKLGEVVSVCTKASSEEKKETYDLLQNLYPTMSTEFEPLKK